MRSSLLMVYKFEYELNPEVDVQMKLLTRLFVSPSTNAMLSGWLMRSLIALTAGASELEGIKRSEETDT